MLAREACGPLSVALDECIQNRLMLSAGLGHSFRRFLRNLIDDPPDSIAEPLHHARDFIVSEEVEQHPMKLGVKLHNIVHLLFSRCLQIPRLILRNCRI